MKITLTEREINEIRLCMFYTENLKHGTAGHNRMVLIASLAYSVGFTMNGGILVVPNDVTIESGDVVHAVA